MNKSIADMIPDLIDAKVANPRTRIEFDYNGVTYEAGYRILCDGTQVDFNLNDQTTPLYAATGNRTLIGEIFNNLTPHMLTGVRIL